MSEKIQATQTTKMIFGVDPAKCVPWYMRVLVRLFGKEFIGSDTNVIVWGHWFRGKLYIKDIKNV